jgi:hypothetical protein
VLAVVLGVMTARFGMMFFGVAGVAVGAVGVVRGLFVIAGLVVFGGFAVMLGGMLVMFGGLVMMLDGVFAHVCAPDFSGYSPADLRTSSDTMLTAARQLC